MRFPFRLRWLPTTLLLGWGSCLTLVTACLMVGHWVSLPHPNQGELLETEYVGNPGGSKWGNTEWHAFHFLYGDCPCSRRVLKHLVQREALKTTTEHLILVGADPKFHRLAQDRGFNVEVVTPTQLKERFGVEAAPLLVITDSQGTIAYSGGYTARKQGLDIQDEDIITRVVHGEKIAGLPLYGCAVSKRLKDIVDPLRIKEARLGQDE